MKAKSEEGARKIWGKYKYAVLVVLIGAGLLLWPVGSEALRSGEGGRKVSQTTWEQTPQLQEEMESILSQISGVGQVKVLLTLDSDGERQLAQDVQLSYSGSTAAPEDYSRKSETVLVDSTGGDEALVTRTVYPTYRGALVVCSGGDRAEVRLLVTEAVSALTGLSTDRISVAKWQ